VTARRGQDLTDDVGREERKSESRKALRKFEPELAHIVGGRPVLRRELDWISPSWLPIVPVLL